ncbi:MAG: DUF167 family protein [Gammaproteobacteria bacterium]
MVQPRGGRDGFVGQIGDRLKVRIRRAPVDGAANLALAKFLAKCFGVTRADVRLVAGHRGRNKTVEIVAPRKIPEEIRHCVNN